MSQISIHAPTRGATRIGGRGLGDVFISIHAPTRGATKCDHGGAAVVGYFNPRAHAGRDGASAVSTMTVHADFNPRAHAGRDGRARCP